MPEEVRTRVLRAYELALPALICTIARQIWCWPVWLRQSYGARIFEVFGDVKAEEHPSHTVEMSLGRSRFVFSITTTGGSSDSEWTWRKIEVEVSARKVFALEMSCRWSKENDEWSPRSVVAFIEGTWVDDIQVFTQKFQAIERLRADDFAEMAAPKIDRKDFGLE